MTFSRGNTKASNLTGVKVLEIRDKYAAGTHTQAMLSREYKVHINTIRNILNGTSWQSIPQVQSAEALETEVELARRRLNRMLEHDLPPAVEMTEEQIAELGRRLAMDQPAETETAAQVLERRLRESREDDDGFSTTMDQGTDRGPIEGAESEDPEGHGD